MKQNVRPYFVPRTLYFVFSVLRTLYFPYFVPRTSYFVFSVLRTSYLPLVELIHRLNPVIDVELGVDILQVFGHRVGA